MNTMADNWHEANQGYLMAALGVVREELERHRKCMKSNAAGKRTVRPESSAARNKLQQAAEKLTAPSSLDMLSGIFGFSPFERDILLMCAGMELDSSFASVFDSPHDGSHSCPTFGQALAALPDAHWSAIMPHSPLRYWRLIEIGPGRLVTRNPLRIDESVLHYLAGIVSMDERLSGIVKRCYSEGELVPSHVKLAESISNMLSRGDKSILPIINLCGEGVLSKRAIAAEACSRSGLNIFYMSSSVIPSDPRESTEFIRLWERERALNGTVLLIEVNQTDFTDGERSNMISRFLESIRSTLIISSNNRIYNSTRPKVTMEIRKPTADEQRMVWERALGGEVDKLNGRLNDVVSQFDLYAETISNVSLEVLGHHEQNDPDQDARDNTGKMIWNACRTHTRPRLDDLAQYIEPRATWDDIVLPDMQKLTLEEIAVHVRQRRKVYCEWGFAAAATRGLGISALFTGESGTGKTMAAEVLANELQLDLYRIDLSQVVNKYIGETEKNLKRVFDAAEEGGAILLFDEADALFGKRSEIKDSHDRYANIEVSYLLQRMEVYRGLAILTTNMKSALDKAFLRRIRFVVHFPFPDTVLRADIWHRIFPHDTPTEGLDIDKLARLNVAGGNIRNIALNAAFLAAEAGGPVRMPDILRAARSEYAKIEKSLSTVETGGWE